MSPLTVFNVEKELSLKLFGNRALLISTICPPDEILSGCTLFLFDKELLTLTDSCADIFFISKKWIQDVTINPQKSYLFCENPKESFVLLLQMLIHQNKNLKRILTFEQITKTFSHATFGLGCLVSEDLSVNQGTVVGEQVFIGHNVTIGKNCVISPGAKILHDTTIGDNCHIGPNTVIGLDGFGYELIDGKMVRIPQIGTVYIENNVDIDANSCIERGTLGSTKIGCGTKIGSLVHIGHNCKIDKNCIIITQSGLAGSCVLEEGVFLSGQVGVGEHSFIGKHTKVGGKSGIKSRSHIPENSRLWGIPAIPKKQFDEIHNSLLKKISTNF